MTFLNPYLLWGTLAIAIPILIHFWHQKRGKVIAWAATQWLTEKNQQQQRGLKFDNLWLLLVRSLLVLLLVLLLSEPVIDWFRKGEAMQPIHLVQPNAMLVDNFRFELETALKKGEKVYWITPQPELLTTLTLPAQSVEVTPLLLQSTIDKLRQKDAPLHLYVLNAQSLADVPFLYVPPAFSLHTVADSTLISRRFLTNGPAKVFVNSANRLTTALVLPPAIRFATEAVSESPLSVLLTFRNPAERQTVRAAIDALNDVYKLNLMISEVADPSQTYAMVLADRLPTALSPKTLYIISGMEQPSVSANVIAVHESFSPQASERVAAGQLPEWLGEQLVQFFGLNPTRLPLSQAQCKGLFVTTPQRASKPLDDGTSSVFQRSVWLAIILLIGVERWLALTKNA